MALALFTLLKAVLEELHGYAGCQKHRQSHRDLLLHCGHHPGKEVCHGHRFPLCICATADYGKSSSVNASDGVLLLFARQLLPHLDDVTTVGAERCGHGADAADSSVSKAL